MNRKIITSQDVARVANVSQSAVSRAFTPGASIAAETRERVHVAAQELGYRPNALARAMISGRSRLIALLVSYMENPFYPAVIDRITRQLKAEGYGVLLLMSDPGRQDNHVAEIMQYQVDGIIVASSAVSDTAAERCAHCGVPVVSFNRFLQSLPVSCVGSDNVEGGRMVADLLIENGFQRIAYIAGTEGSSANRAREAGFTSALAAHGKAVFARAVGGDRHDQAKIAARELFDQQDIPDAVFVANDHMAIAVMDVLRDELKLRIPQDVSVVGFDDVPAASWAGYNLTTVSQNLSVIVNRTLEILLGQINTQKITATNTLVPVKLEIRGTVRMACEKSRSAKNYSNAEK